MAATIETIENSVTAGREDVFSDAQEWINRLESFERADTIELGDLPTVDYRNDATLSVEDFLLRFVPTQALFPASIAVPLPPAPDVSFTAVDTPSIPEFTRLVPELALPTPPSADLPSAPVAPSVAEPEIPTAPVVSLPTVPTFTPVTVPLPPSVDIPSFTAGLPAEDFFTPSNTFEWAEEAYASELLDAQKAKLLDNLENGGYGIETADESALWERARERELENARAATESVFAETASRGFPIPPGSSLVALQRAHQELQNRMSEVSREIALKRADLYVENRKFTIQEVRSLEAVLIGFHNSVQERALNAAKTAIEVAVSIYEAQLKRYNARLDAYRTEAQVFESKIRAALSQVEIFRTTMEGKRLEVDVQRQTVELYRAQLNGVESVINIYRAQMEAAGVRAGIERTRIDAFRALIDAYTAQVGARTAQFGMYEAQVRGEIAKVQAFEAEVRAYAARVEGLKSAAEIKLGNLRAETDQARAKADIYRSDIAAGELSLRAQVEVIDTITKRYGIDVQKFQSQLSALAEAYRLQQQRERDARDADFKTADVQLKNAELKFRALQQVIEAKLGAHRIASGYFGPVLAGYVQALQAIVSRASTEA